MAWRQFYLSSSPKTARSMTRRRAIWLMPSTNGQGSPQHRAARRSLRKHCSAHYRGGRSRRMRHYALAASRTDRQWRWRNCRRRTGPIGGKADIGQERPLRREWPRADPLPPSIDALPKVSLTMLWPPLLAVGPRRAIAKVEVLTICARNYSVCPGQGRLCR